MMGGRKSWRAIVLLCIFALPHVGLGADLPEEPEAPSKEQESTDEDGLNLSVNQSRVVDVPGVTHVAVGSGEILQVEVIEANDQILLIGLQPGITDIRYWTGDGGSGTRRVVVGPPENVVRTEPTRDELAELLGLDEGSGDLRIVEMADSLNIQGVAESQNQHDWIQVLAARFSSVHAYVQPPSLDVDETIFIEAQFIEVTQSGLKEIGFEWGESTDGPVFANASDYSANDLFRPEFSGLESVDQGGWPLDIGTDNTFFGWGFRLDSVINLLVNSGQARVLAEPVLSTLSGQEADFHSGGEFPIPTRDEDGAITTEFREFGIGLNVLPEAGGDGQVRTEVTVEVSDADFSRVVRDIPAIDSSRAQTVMQGESGRSLVIAGLLNEESSKSVSKLPGLGELPIIGEFFKSRRLDSERRELIIIVTPHIAGTGSRMNRDMLQRSGDLVDQGARDTRFRLLD